MIEIKKELPANLELCDLEKLDSSFLLDIRYATTNNFLNKKFYPIAKAYLEKSVAQDLLNAQNEFLKLGYGIIIYDAYRPWHVTKIFWDSVSSENQKYVANPDTGSAHNRAAAVDINLYSLDTKKPVPQPSEFDEMSIKSHLNYNDCSEIEKQMRSLLQEVMSKHNFKGLAHEWWHFTHKNYLNFPILDVSFLDIEKHLYNTSQ
jgi:D-alanyl-D-alanine dipeptidase